MEKRVAIDLGPWWFLLFLTFLILKLTHVIAWSWLWVTAPLWGGLVLSLAIFMLVVVVAGLLALIAGLKGR